MCKIRNPNIFVNILKKEDNIKIYVDTDIISICSLKILTVILTKEYIKHEIIFIEDGIEIDKTNAYIYLEDSNLSYYEDKDTLPFESAIDPDSVKSSILNEENELISAKDKRVEYDNDKCGCIINNLNRLMSLYSLSKSLQVVSTDILWSVIVCFSYYKYFIFVNEKLDNEDSSSNNYEMENENICIDCNKSLDDLYLDIKKNTKISVRKDLRYPLLYHSELYFCLKNDIYFSSKHRLFYKKRKDLEEYKLKNYLASTGISIKVSKEKFSNLEYSIKSYIYRVLEKIDLFYKKTGNLEYSSLDMYFLMNYYIIRKKYVQAYMLLDSKHYFYTSDGNKKSVKSYVPSMSSKFIDYIFNINSILKDAISNNMQYKDIVIFRTRANNVDFKAYSMFVYNQLSIYCRYKNYDKFLLVLENKDKEKQFTKLEGKENFNNSTQLENSIQSEDSNYVILYGYNIKLLKDTINGYKLADKITFYREILKK